MSNIFKISVLPGDGIGPEIMIQAIKILECIQKYIKKKIIIDTYDIGGIAINKYNDPLPKKTLDGCEKSNAILLGSVGGPEWDHLPLNKRPEKGSLLKLRKYFNLFVNLRPSFFYKNLNILSPLKDRILNKGFDIICVRELIGGIYFGLNGRKGKGINEYAFDTEIYSRFEIERIAHIAFNIALKRNKKICSIDKANVLQTSILWREILIKISKKYKSVKLKHMYIDNAVMQLIKNPSQFDVILCPNLFGDIISDQCAIITGSIGNLPSASFNQNYFGLYEPAGGSAPDIAGKNIANPIAQILSLAMLIEYSLKEENISLKIKNAIQKVLNLGYRTKDISVNSSKEKIITTNDMGTLIMESIV
ncbi:3-isopropylmalate dehydrogenase [Enterobacteriaceae endosymbiont of Donacia cincticornis]|uniref:3-isopropylmalate dehydrogenase n=1 Tax=Enterobacteriaceae endosymbiont of Donacia cincticornis TaxID=2675773 RepID=UPI001448EE41|nr:3-isopropylmalate dehydrogenase [Enterobacteriaceae endosymbiont of Donacia cincticornis]QJC35954.1 3-isopropylmalate dehydrogenase [Enterobacteriaceae endosymbiont of Donacia cincticornis]